MGGRPDVPRWTTALRSARAVPFRRPSESTLTTHRAPKTAVAPSGAGFERVDTLVIGAGQAGLAVGYELARRGVSFTIVDGSARIGDAWRQRWSSLRLFTPALYDGLPGAPFPAPRFAMPTKDEMADYLEDYAQRFALPVRLGVRIERLNREDGGFVAVSEGTRFVADHVVVAMSGFQTPRIPAFASRLAADVVQLHSLAYRDPSQLRDGPVLVVGAGNSGAEIAVEVAATHRTALAGRATGHLPFSPSSFVGRLMGPVVLGGLFHRVLTTDTPMGRRAQPRFLSHGGPLIRLRPRDLVAAGVERLPRVQDVRDGKPVLADGRTLDVANVIWCTGFDAALPWIDLPVFDGDGRPRHVRGIATDVPGLAFVGLPFLYALSSTMIYGAARDAAFVVHAMHGPVSASGRVRRTVLN